MNKFLLYFSLLLLTISSCKKEKENDPPVIIDTCEYKSSGLQKNDPWEWNAMRAKAAANALILRKPTHQYVKVLITNSEQYAQLSSIGVFFPFDISREPDENSERKSSATSEGVWMYGYWPEGLENNAFRKEKLYDIYIPETNSIEEKILSGKSIDKNAKVTSSTIQGKINYYDPIAKSLKGIKGVRVSIIDGTRNYGIISQDDGSFSIDKSIVSDKAEIILQFDNSYMEIRTLDFDNLLGILIPNTFSLGMKKACAFSNLNIEIGTETTNAALQHSIAALHVYNQFCDFARKNGYGIPSRKLNLWVAKDAAINSSYAAPMLRNLNTRFEARDLLINLFNIPPSLASTLANAIKKDLPDIYAPFYQTNANKTPIGFIEALFHEFSHATHFTRAGNDYWSRYIEHIFNGGGYGDGTGAESGLVALSESFAEDLSLEILADVYGNAVYTAELRDKNTSPSYPWIPWGIYYDLNDVADNEPFDVIGGFTFHQLYELLSPETDHPDKLKQKLFERYAVPADDQNKVETLFEHYGF